MKTKNLLLVIVIMLGLAISFGCISTNNSKTVQSEPTPTSSNSTLTPIPTPTKIETDGKLASQSAPTPTSKASTKSEESSSSVESSTTVQFSDAKKEELIKLIEKDYSGKNVNVVFSANENGMVFVQYEVTSVPGDLRSDISGVLTLANMIARESGIPNASSNVIVTLTDETPIGVGTYYALKDKMDIDVS